MKEQQPKSPKALNQNEDEIFQHKSAAEGLAQNHYCFIHNSDLFNEVSVLSMQNSKAF